MLIVELLIIKIVLFIVLILEEQNITGKIFLQNFNHCSILVRGIISSLRVTMGLLVGPMKSLSILHG